MRDFVIMTDSGCDLSQSMVESLGIKVVPMNFVIDGQPYRHYHDFRDLSKEDFYNKIKSGCVGTTHGVNIKCAYNAMKEILIQRLDILYLSFSSKMSYSYLAAAIAAKELKDEYPESNIHIIDTLSVSVGLGMLVYLSAKKKAAGENIDEIAKWVNAHRQNICHYFMVDDLKYIPKTSKISHLTTFIGTLLGIKPVFKLSKKGKIKSDIKVRNKRAGIDHLIKRMQEKCTGAKIFFICHADVEEEAQALKEKVLETYPDSKVIVNCAGPIIGNNTGPGALALIFFGDER